MVVLGWRFPIKVYYDISKSVRNGDLQEKNMSRRDYNRQYN